MTRILIRSHLANAACFLQSNFGPNKWLSYIKSMLMKKIANIFQVRKYAPRIGRNERILNYIQPSGKRGIEVGALNRPIVTHADGDVLYADHLSTEELRKKYAYHSDINANEFSDLVDVNIVTGRGSLWDAIGEREKFDYIVASHVLEHIADPIGWLNGCTRILNEGGIIFLALPDRRFTFDRFRVETTTGEMLANYHYKAVCPTPAQIFEYNARSVHCSPKDVRKIWRGEFDDSARIDEGRLKEALRLEIDVSDNNTYLECHCSIFTPYSFSRIIYELILLGVVKTEVVAIDPTRENEAEFFVVLRKNENQTPGQLSSTVPDLDPIRHGQTPAKRLKWSSRPTCALRILLGGRSK